MLLRRALLLWVLLGASCAALSEDASPNVRAEFRRAYDGALNGESAGADSQALRDYALYAYLQRARILAALSESSPNFDKIDRESEAFLKTHGGEPAAFELRRQWYASLATRQQWPRLLANYRDINDATLRCHALTARLTLQRMENLESAVAAMWAAAPQSLQACEPVFTWLQSLERFTPAMVEQRARLALVAGNVDFAKQLIATLPDEIAAPLKTWSDLIAYPARTIDTLIAKPSLPVDQAALLDGWTRLARADPGAAMRRYASLASARRLDQSLASRYALEVALVLAWSRRPETLSYFAKVRPEDLDERGFEWYARAALWADDWRRAGKVIAAMPEPLRQQARWRYWAARMEERRGNRNEAARQYAAMLGDDNFYAALAAARIKTPYAPRPQPLPIDEAQVQTLAQLPALRRAQELLAVDLRAFAYDEWRAAMRSLDAGARLQAVMLASRWGWHDQAILTAAEQRLFDDYDLLYPHPFDAQVRAAAETTRLPASLIYAIVRQESLYRPDAVSSADARGLMQLRMGTAKITARRWRLREPDDLFDPNVNIPIGAAHVRDMIDRFSGQPIIAIAAYNAGPGAAARWLPAKNAQPSDVWIENIPYNETRTYVQRVLWHSVVFGWRASGQPQDTTAWLTSMKVAGKK